MSFEGIDEPKERRDLFALLIEDVVNFLATFNEADPDIKSRLQLERKLHMYANSATPDWLLNLIVAVDKDRHK